MDRQILYDNWIKDNVVNPRAKCKIYAELMIKTFPELRLVRGHYYCFAWGAREHWWCETPKGKIVDPTKQQFPSLGNGTYEEHTGPEPLGKCLNCRNYCYENEHFCCSKCEKVYMDYLNKPCL